MAADRVEGGGDPGPTPTGDNREMTMEERVLVGQLWDLPDIQGNGVQVFLSSTFTDYTMERNMLMKEAVPELRKYCLGRNLDFQISDMRWGVRDEAQDDHNTTDLCLSEIPRCQRQSRGPYFVCFLGDKYGFRPYPNIIEKDEYEIIYRCAKELGKEIKLLDEWYYLDENAVPNQYILQSISSKFPYYNNESEENQENREKEMEEWNAIDKLFVYMFRDSADKACKDGLISTETRHKYFQSVTENEVDHGILSAENVNDRTLYFSRKFKCINYTDTIAKRFENLDGKEADVEARELLDDLKNTKVPGSLDNTNIHFNTIDWTPQGIDEKNADHAKYLHEIRDVFIKEMKRLIDLHVDQGHQQKFLGLPALFKEVLHQSMVAKKKCQVFCGRQDLVKEIREKLSKEFGKELTKDEEELINLPEKEDAEANGEQAQQVNSEAASIKEFMKTNGIGYAMEDEPINLQEDKCKVLQKPAIEKYTKPLVICGESGSGKTALMAHVVSKIDEWVAPIKPVKVVRFLGTSSQSSYIHDTLISVVKQIWCNYDIKPEFEDDLTQNFMFAMVYFNSVLFKIDSKSKPLFIILDSVDQLHPRDHAHNLNWMPRELPTGVHLMISTLPDLHNCLKSAENLISDDSRFIKMCVMDSSSGEETLWKWMETLKRTLTKEQKDLVMEKFNNCQQPLFMLLAAREASLWRSYDKMSSCILGSTIVSAINVLFDRLEAKHGKILVSKALGYLTASRQGLTDLELEDVLSLDDEVLQDTYIYHLPPDAENIRLPPSLWRRIQLDLGEYLVIRQASDKDCITWYHRQFKEAAQTRYLTEGCECSIHSFLVDYFDGKWSDKIKPLELFKKKKGSYPNAMRSVSSQPLQYGPSKYNLRKLQELPIHLVKSKQFEDFIQNICRNFEWIHTKCKAFSVIELLAEMDMAVQYLQGMDMTDDLEKVVKEMKTLHSCLLMASDAIQKNADNLAIQLIGQFQLDNTHTPDGLRTLQTQAMEWVRMTKTALIVPKTQCLPSPGTELLLSLELTIAVASDTDHFEVKLALQKESCLLYAVDHISSTGDIIKIYNTAHYCELIRQQHMPNTDFKSIHLVGNDKFLHCEVYTKRDTYNPKFKRVLLTANLSEVQYIPKAAQVLCVSDDGGLCFIQAEDEKGKYSAVFDVNTHHEQRLHLEEFEEYQDALFSDDFTLVVTFSKEIAIWDIKSGTHLHNLLKDEDKFAMSFSHHEDYKMFMKPVPGCRLVGRGRGYNTKPIIHIWDLKSGEVLKEMTGHSYKVDIIGISQSYKRAVTGTRDSVSSSDCGPKFFRVWDLEEGEEIACSEGLMTGPYSVLDFVGTQEDLILACTCFEKESMIYQLHGKEMILVYEIHGHNERMVFGQCTFSEDIFLTASVDNTLQMWLMKDISRKIEELKERCPTKEDIEKEWQDKKQLPFKAGEGKMETRCFAVSRDGKSAAVGTADGWILFYDLQTHMITKHQRPDTAPVEHMLATSNAKYFVSTGTGVYLWDATSGEMVHELVGPTVHGRAAMPSCLAESCDKLVVGYGGMECYGDVYDLKTGTKDKSLPGLYGFGQVDISSDAKKVASTFFEMPVIYDIETGESSMNMENNDVMMCGATCVVFSPGDKFLVGGATDGSVRVLEVQGGAYKFRFQHRSTVANAAFSQDNEMLITSGFNTILIWCLKKGVLLHTLSRHQDFIMDLIFACDGQYLVTCSKDKKILVWSIADFVTVATFYSHCAVKRISVAPDLSSIIYCPDNVAYLGILQPNPALQALSKGESSFDVPETMQKAQALAFAFSGEKISVKSARTCNLM